MLNTSQKTSASALEQWGHRPFCPLRIVADPALGEADADATEQKGLWKARMCGIKKKM